MSSFSTLTGVAAPLPEADIDTDIIFPARFLLLLDKKGLGQHLFHERRRKDANGVSGFVLDQPPFDRAKILVAGPNFGSGSSREQAVWALMDAGIGCVIAPSFGEIFYANAFKNGLLAIVLDAEWHQRVMDFARSGAEITVDLEAQTIGLGDGQLIRFDIDPTRKRTLLLGLDEIGSILEDDAIDIAAFETCQRAAAPWLYLTPAQLAFFSDLQPETALPETAI